eukprot:3700450-Rhodomonas_salina.5
MHAAVLTFGVPGAGCEHHGDALEGEPVSRARGARASGRQRPLVPDSAAICIQDDDAVSVEH